MSVKNPKYEYKNIICNGCGVKFDSITRNKKQKYCSKSCAGKSNKNSGRFNKGDKSWNTGTTNSGMKGKTHSTETKEKMRRSSLGELASNWHGGKTDENYRVRRSRKYADWRTGVFVRDDYTCQICGDKSTGGNRVRLNADHIKPFAFYPELRFELSNGRTLCEPCHRKTPTYGNHKDFTGKQATLESTGETFNAAPL